MSRVPSDEPICETSRISVKLDDLLYARRMTLTELAEKVEITLANLSILKTGKAKAIRFSTLAAICGALDCQPGDLLGYRGEDRATAKMTDLSAPRGGARHWAGVARSPAVPPSAPITLLPLPAALATPGSYTGSVKPFAAIDLSIRWTTVPRSAAHRADRRAQPRAKLDTAVRQAPFREARAKMEQTGRRAAPPRLDRSARCKTQPLNL